MALAWKEIKDRADLFQGVVQAESEDVDAKSFWIELSDQPATRRDYQARREKGLIRARTPRSNCEIELLMRID